MARNSIIKAGRLAGLDDLQAVLQGVPQDLRGRILADGVRAGARPIRDGARRLAPRDTGALAKSIDIVVRRYRGAAVAVVGPDRSYYRGRKRVKRGESARGAARPANYAHLVEFGHVAVANRKGTSLRKGTATALGYVPAKPFLRPAVLGAAGAAGDAIHRAVAEGVAASIRKHAARGREI